VSGEKRGRIDKREAILDAAFKVFARDGYRPAGVDVIAAEAGVAKHTIYNHFGDKEKLFREVIGALCDQALERNLAAVALLRDASGDDLRAALTGTGQQLAECYCDERSWALRRLLNAEITSMPDLLDIIRDRTSDRVYEALADRFAPAGEPLTARYQERPSSRTHRCRREGSRDLPARLRRYARRDSFRKLSSIRSCPSTAASSVGRWDAPDSGST